MYLDFFGLEREPFHITPDPEFLFPSPSHKEAFATVMYGVQQQKGFVVVTGEVGTGKTTILRAYLQKLKGSDIQPIYIFDPHLGFDELLEAVLAELGAPHDAGNTQFARLQWLRHYLIDAYSSGRSVVLIIDEAQNMPVETLEQLRVLTNLETTKDKLLQVLLVGQPELEDKLALHQLRQLNQRVAVRATLRPLASGEALDYVKHRVRQAGGIPENIFDPGALKAIVGHAQGNPRVLNITSDNVLISAFGAQQCPISARLVREVLRELKPVRSRNAAPDWKRFAPLAAAASVAAIIGAAALAMFQPDTRVNAAAPLEETPTRAVQAESVEAVAAVEASTPPERAREHAAEENEYKEMAVQRMLGKEIVPPPAPQPEPIQEETVAPVAPTEPVPSPKLTETESPVEASADDRDESATAAAEVSDEESVALARVPEATERRVEDVVEATPAAEAEAKPLTETEPQPEPEISPKADTAPAEPEAPKVAKVETPDSIETKAAAPVTAPESALEPEPEMTSPPPATTVAAVAPAPAAETEPAAKAEPARMPEPAAPLEPLEPSLKVERDANGRLVRKVEKGDKLLLLLEEVYGKSNPSLLQNVQQANPEITDPNRILAGEDLVFPEMDRQPENTAPGASPGAGN